MEGKRGLASKSPQHQTKIAREFTETKEIRQRKERERKNERGRKRKKSSLSKRPPM
jgi:hypothetical protein